MNVTPPWSRRLATQPQRVTDGAGVLGAELAAGVAPHRGPVDAHALASGASLARSAVARDLVLRPVGEPAERDDAGVELALAQDRRVRGTGAVGHLELRLQGPSSNAASAGTPAARRSRTRSRARARPASPTPTTNDDQRRLLGRRDPLLLERQQHPLEAHPEPDPRDVRPAEHLGQPVVPAAAEQRRVLRREVGAHELERGPRVVVEPAHERRRRRPAIPASFRPAWTPLEVLAARVAEAVGDPRRLGRDRPARLVLAVEDAQRVVLEPIAVLVGEPVAVLAEVRPASSSRYAGRHASSPIEFTCSSIRREPQLAEERVADGDHLDVGARVLEPNTSIPNWRCSRYRPSCGRAYRYIRVR